MGIVFIILGILLIIITLYDLKKEETDTILASDWLWFDVSRTSSPLLFWGLIAFQLVSGVVMVYQGLTGTWKSLR